MPRNHAKALAPRVDDAKARLARIEGLRGTRRSIYGALERIPEGLTYDRIAAHIGSVPRSVSSACGAMLRDGLLQEKAGESRSGRKAALYAVAEAYRGIALERHEQLAMDEIGEGEGSERLRTLARAYAQGGGNPMLAANAIIEELLKGEPDPDDNDGDEATAARQGPRSGRRSSRTEGRLRRQVYDAVLERCAETGEGMTREEIGARTGLWMSTLLPRIDELIKSGLLKEEGSWRDPVTRRRRKLVVPDRLLLATAPREIEDADSPTARRRRLNARIADLMGAASAEGDAGKAIDEAIALVEGFVRRRRDEEA